MKYKYKREQKIIMITRNWKTLKAKISETKKQREVVLQCLTYHRNWS